MLRTLHASRGRWLPSRILIPTLLATAAGIAAAEEPVPPMARIAPRSGPRVDPMQASRLSAEGREQLYAQVQRDAEILERQSMQFRRLAQLIRPTVVHIDARRPALRPRNGKASEDETGSGVIVEVAGRTVVITNRHVVNRANLDSITIRLDDSRELRPMRLWSDAATDIAVLEIEGDDLPRARLALDDPAQIGDAVLAVGSPFGLSHSVTLGIVSALGRRDLELGQEGVRFQDFIQTDAAINPGNSGGPLVNLRGEVVGLNTCIASNSGGSEGIGFAIPIRMVVFVARQLVETGTVARAYLGVKLDNSFSQRAAQGLGMVRAVGAHVKEVTRGAPADAAGIRIDDVIVEFDGVPVEDDDHLVSLVSMTPTSSTVTVVVFRDQTRLTLQMPVASRDQYE
ncbi:MAG: PDZ domain-containing protein [Planctomycetia bacterium]|nr:PDZ domain-containing protein [Planctomycetia bacterium]